MSNNLKKTTLGRTGLEVTQLGYGAMEIGGQRTEVTDKQSEDVLNAVLDSGITFIDTSPDYGLSEERIGKYISQRRDEYFLSTKCGCNITYPEGTGQEPSHLWKGEVFLRNIENSLKRMKVDHVDILQMHNPSGEEVEKNGLVDVLEEIRSSGKTRFIGVSSTAPNLLGFARMGVFDSFQIPYSLLERVHEDMIREAAGFGAGIIIRGGIAKGHREPGERWAKWEKAGLNDLLGNMSRYEFVLRFTLSHPDCNTTIVGTADQDHLRANVAAAQAGPLPGDVYAEAARRLSAIGESPGNA
jgi:aryl-alcohol dehydrogenase-like predicted oxidoreductase